MIIYTHEDRNPACSLCYTTIKKDDFKMIVELDKRMQLRFHTDCASSMKEQLWDFVNEYRCRYKIPSLKVQRNLPVKFIITNFLNGYEDTIRKNATL